MLKAAPRSLEPAPRSGRGRWFDSNSWKIWSVRFRASAVSVSSPPPRRSDGVYSGGETNFVKVPARPTLSSSSFLLLVAAGRRRHSPGRSKPPPPPRVQGEIPRSAAMSGGDVVCSGWLRKSPPEKKLRRYVSALYIVFVALCVISGARSVSWSGGQTCAGLVSCKTTFAVVCLCLSEPASPLSGLHHELARRTHGCLFLGFLPVWEWAVCLPGVYFTIIHCL